MFKKLIGTITLALYLLSSTVFADNIVIDKLKGLQLQPQADSIDDGGHAQFDNVYINYGNINVVKGRDRLNTTANADVVVNGFFYYENQAGTTKKLVVAESTSLVSYNTDGTSRTVLASSLTNEEWRARQIGDTLYLTSTTNGLYKWTGSGSATIITGVSAPSSLSFSASATAGGLTAGIDAIAACKTSTSFTNDSGTCVGTSKVIITSDDNNVACSSLSTSNYVFTCATSSTYQYKVTAFSSISAIESEPSSSSSVNLAGANTVNNALQNAFNGFTSITCASAQGVLHRECEIQITGEQTSTTSTTAAAPPTPFDSYCIYRTVANGSDYFKLGCTKSFSSTYTDGKPDVTLATPLDTTIDTITPPAFKYIEEYKGVIFIAENDTIKFSRIPVALVTNADKYWLDTDELRITGNITALIKASDSLLIFTTNSIYQLVGFGSESFRLVPIVSGIGAINDRSISIDTNGDVIFFSGTSGVYKLSIGQQKIDSLSGSIIDSSGNAHLIKVSSPNLDEMFTGNDESIVLTPSTYSASHAYYDNDNELYWLFIDTHAFLFNQKSNTWSHIPATKMLASLWRKSPNSAGTGVLIDNLGFFFNNWTGYEMGIQSGTVTGSPTSSTTSTLTCSTCTFNTTGDGLKGLWINVDNENQEYQQITSNTTTIITINGTWTTNPITSDVFYIAYIIPVVLTKQYSFIKPPDESKSMMFYLNHNKSVSTQTVIVESFQEKSDIPINQFTFDMSQKFINVFNTRMRSSWMQWKLKTFIYNISNTIDSPFDIISYIVDADSERSVNRNG